MANIPTIPGTSRVQDVQLGAKASAAPIEQRLQAAKGAINAGGQAIIQAASEVEDYELRKRKAEEAAFFNKTAITLMNATGDFRHTLRQQKDSEIVNNWQQQVEATKDTVLSDPDAKQLSPQASRQLQMHLGMWDAQSTNEFQVKADELGSQRREQIAVAASDAFALTGDPALRPNAERAIKMAVKTGDMSEEAGNMRMAMLDYKFKAGEVANLITYNPKRAFEQLSDSKKYYPEITNPDTILTLKQKAKRQWDENMSAGYEQVRKAQDGGHIWTRPKLQNMADGGQLEQKSIDTILKQQAGKVKQESIPANTMAVHKMLLDISPTSTADERLSKVTEIHGSTEYQSLPEAVKKDFDDAMKQMSKKETPKPNPVQTSTFARLKADPMAAGQKQINQLTQKLDGEYVMSDADVKRVYGKPRNEAVESLYSDQANQWGQMRQWFKSYQEAHPGKQPSDDEAESARQKIIMTPHLDQAASQATQTPVASQQDLQKIQNNLAAGKAWHEGVAQKVRVRSPDGKEGTIPASNLDQAVKSGYTILQ